jgi:hypothetical protein
MAGARPLTVAVVTPHHSEDLALLRRCHQSVLAQTYPCRHIMVADGLPRSCGISSGAGASPSISPADSRKASGGGDIP